MKRTIAVMAAALALAWSDARAGEQEKGEKQQTGEKERSQAGSQAQGGTGSGGQSARSADDPLMKQGPAVKGHASDKIISGRVAEVSEDKVKIEGKGGKSKDLELAPQTLIDGKTGNHQALKEGEQVRASYDEMDGKSVAVEIHSRQGAGKGASSGQGGSMERGSTGSQQDGSQQQGGTGSGSPQQGGSDAGSQQGGSQQR
jgi:hypothetical protein